jgi:DnaJ homolog subfamily C member 28
MVDKNEEQIRRALEEGGFDDLPGKGKPLNLDDNPFEDPEWRAANQMLRSAGFSLPWMETRKSIEAELVSVLHELQRAWRQYQRRMSESHSYSHGEAEWQRAVLKFEEKVADLNKQIFTYNLEAPNLQLQRRKIDPQKEIDKVKNSK